jgi:hypothetical protein
LGDRLLAMPACFDLQIEIERDFQRSQKLDSRRGLPREANQQDRAAQTIFALPLLTTVVSVHQQTLQFLHERYKAA